MISRRARNRRSALGALALAMGVWVYPGAAVRADDPPCAGNCPPQQNTQPRKGLFHKKEQTFGTLGYGPPGLFPGFQGFGLGYHLGYGYGGEALGVGCDGGYPFYGGPGYPCAEPQLRRIGPIVPFPHNPGPGSPTPDHPNYYAAIGPLAADQPVITIGDDNYSTGYGGFTGSVPYPEEVLAPFTTRAASGAANRTRTPANPAPTPTPGPETRGLNTPPGPSPGPDAGPVDPALGPGAGALAPAAVPVAERSLGVDTDPFVDAAGTRGMKVARVEPGSTAEKAGLLPGDVIHSINGYVTTKPGNLEWIVIHAAGDNVLKMSVRTARDGQVHTVTGKLF